MNVAHHTPLSTSSAFHPTNTPEQWPASHVVSIAPSAPFIPTLVKHLLAGKLFKNFNPHDPLALSRLTLWVPTQRAAHAMAEEFVKQMPFEAALLPHIKALGAIEEEDPFLEQAPPQALNATIAPLERHLILSKLINHWAQHLKPDQRDLYQGADILMPASLSDAIWFAQDLMRLMDMVATEEADWHALDTLVEEDQAEWWQLTLEFLKIATRIWPQILKERGLEDRGAQRSQMLRQQSHIYRTKGAEGPVIIAGSTGSIPATAALIQSIAALDNGLVVLPGLDRDLDEETWQKIDLPDNDRDDSGTAPTHPQYGLKRLLDQLNLQRAHDDILYLENMDTALSPDQSEQDQSEQNQSRQNQSGFLRIREHLVSEALRPSFSTGQWQKVLPRYSAVQKSKAFENVTLIEAEGERQEALAIALALRETLNETEKSAALITPDRNLARRVRIEMRRFNVDVDDSAGHPLQNRPQGTFLRLVLQVGFLKPNPIALISLLKHPFARFGASAHRARHSARLFELVLLRGAINPPQHGDYLNKAQQAEKAFKEKTKNHHPAIGRMSPQDWHDLKWLAGQLDIIFANAPLIGQTKENSKQEQEQLQEQQKEQGQKLPLDHLAQHTITWVEACALGIATANTTKQTKPNTPEQAEEKTLAHLYHSDGGKALLEFFADLKEYGDLLQASPEEWPDVIEALISTRTIRLKRGGHPRLAILGPIEARMQHFDRVVLAGLNEKTWPAQTKNDPFLSRPMKRALHLPPPERRIGLAAHDFQMLMGAQDVILTRAVKVDNAPAIASRWIQRIQMVVGDGVYHAMQTRGQKYLHWAKEIDRPKTIQTNSKQPCPCPPVHMRPKKLSITEIATWIKDPYAIYSKHILKLIALEPLSRQADSRERGILYHKILEEFIKNHAALLHRAAPQESDDHHRAIDQLLFIAEKEFNAHHIPLEQKTLWWPRFKNIAQLFITHEQKRGGEIAACHAELYGKSDQGLDHFTLSGRVDRIDLLNNGHIAIIDYKTGERPQINDVQELNDPQLPLSAGLALRGAFGETLARPTDSLNYIRLKENDVLKCDSITHEAKKNQATADQLIEQSYAHLNHLIKAYQDPEKGYPSKARWISDTDWPNDYDHLARLAEWSIAEGGDE